MDTNMIDQLRTAKADAEHLKAELSAAEEERDRLRQQLAEVQQQLAAAQRESAQARQSNERMQTILGEFAEVKRLVAETQQAIIKELINEWSMVVGAPMKTTIKEVNELFKHQAELRDDLHQTLAGFNDGVKTLKGQTAKHIKETGEYVTYFRASMEHCDEAVQACTAAAERCVTFKADYEQTAEKAGESMRILATTTTEKMQDFTDRMQANLKKYVEAIKSRAQDAMMPVVERVEHLTEAQLKRRWMFASMGFMLCLAVVVGTTYLLQQRLSGEVLKDAARWRNYTSELTPQQYDRVTALIKEIEAEQEAAEAARRNSKSPAQSKGKAGS